MTTSSPATLAIDGGSPVMSTPLPPTLHGVMEIGEEEIEAVVAVLKRKTIFRFLNDAQTSESAQLEAIYREYCGVDHALAVCGGTAALICALAGLGIGSGDEVLVPGYTYIATAAACLSIGAIPIMVEVDESLTMDPNDIESKITPYTKAIIPVHMRGVPCDMASIMAIAEKHGLKVLEDVAQANGGVYQGQVLGSIGDAGAFSFQHYKMITAGEGGMVTAKDQAVYRRAAIKHDSAMQFWKDDENWESFAGENFRMCEMRAALGLAQYPRMKAIVERCNSIKLALVEGTKDLPKIQQQKLPDAPGDCGIVFAFFTEDGEKADAFGKALEAEGVENMTIYNKAIPDRHIYAYWDYVMEKKTSDPSGWPWTAAHRDIEYQQDMLPQTLNVLGRCVSIGISQAWTDEQRDDVIVAIRKVHDGLCATGLL